MMIVYTSRNMIGNDDLVRMFVGDRSSRLGQVR
jgi:hypothetical protein